jgi:hypothetical protein
MVSIKSPLTVDSKAEISPRELSRTDVMALKKKGYDGIIVRSASGAAPSEVVAFDKSQVWVTEVR